MMRIFTWCDPVFFPLMSTMIKTLRIAGHHDPLTVLLIEFSPDESVAAKRELDAYDVDEYWTTSMEDYPAATDRTQFCRNVRVDFFVRMLTEHPKDDLLTIAANALIRHPLYDNGVCINDIVAGHDFLFLERPNLKVPGNPSTIAELRRVATPVLWNSVESRAKQVLLGTHAMRNTPEVLEVIKRWQQLVRQGSEINTCYADMGNFVRALVEVGDETGYTFNNYTSTDSSREAGPFCDCRLFKKQSCIWFAKGAFDPRNRRHLKRFRIALKCAKAREYVSPNEHN
jgi:hypothetical protein